MWNCIVMYVLKSNVAALRDNRTVQVTFEILNELALFARGALLIDLHSHANNTHT